MNENQKLIVITAPSGAGKTSITHFLVNQFAQLIFSVSATTRLPRADEKNGVDYYFISTGEFLQKIHDDAFVEWEMVYKGKYYGTLKTELEKIWNENKTPILDIDVKGAIHVQEQYRENSLSIFIEPPSIEALKKRLESRGTETQKGLQTRLSKATYEISFKHYFDIIIINDDFDKACAETEAAVKKFLEVKVGN
ncbi:MAG: guanylate kinase [Chitinophagaceae bacterium]